MFHFVAFSRKRAGRITEGNASRKWTQGQGHILCHIFDGVNHEQNNGVVTIAC